MSVLYHPGKANVVEDALSCMTMGSISHIDEAKKFLAREVHWLARLGVRLEGSPNGGAIVHHNSESSLVVEVKSKKHLDRPLMDLKEFVLGELNESFSLGGDGVLRYHGGLCVPDVDGLREQILEEVDGYRYSIHLGLTKMYHDLREIYWWEGFKRDIEEFVAKCPNCQQVKAEYQKQVAYYKGSEFLLGSGETSIWTL
ncbi:uncharacterized protein [Solanum lycopersicum]|uniref:uncharacterized protein n=1 Tax=Solanum lycopersicum TaxID=4081 RepID=UPI003749E6BB